MAPCNKWWILCAVSLYTVARFGSCRRHGEDGAQPELFIFNELCALKDDPGPCKAIKDRFFFNVDTGHCELFEYGGCEGNDNNFETLEACEETCVVSDDKNPCHLPEAPGPCRGLVKRYAFDSNIQQCRHFFYGGCFGNANNFKSMAECQAKCQNPAKPTKTPEVHTHSARKSAVQPTTVTGALAVHQPQVQGNDTDLARKGALAVHQPQVQGNDTDLARKDVRPTELCFRAVDRGTCNRVERRFAFNPKTKRCQMFYYSGCGGNENNFMHRKDCIKKCSKAHGTRRIRIRKKNINNIVNRSV